MAKKICTRARDYHRTEHLSGYSGASLLELPACVLS